MKLSSRVHIEMDDRLGRPELRVELRSVKHFCHLRLGR